MHFLPSVPAMAIVLVSSSCMTFQYATVSSDLPETLNHEYIFENDSVVIRYNFNGENCPVSVYVENKLNTPLYIDWQRSAIILNNQSIPYWENKSIIQGTAGGTTYSSFYKTRTVVSESTEISGSIRQNESTTFLPPRSFRQTNLVTLENNLIPTPSPKKDYSEKIYTSAGKAQVYYYGFEKENSPRRFRSFITFSTKSSFETTFTLDHEFWISGITETWLEPSGFSKEKNKGNQYYIKHYQH